MITLIFCLRRLPSLSHQEFLDYWFTQHAPLVRRHAEALRIQGYRQHHGLDHPVNAALAKHRGAPAPYDGIAELLFADIEDLNPDHAEARSAAAALLEDERKFIDLAGSPLWVNQARAVIG